MPPQCDDSSNDNVLCASAAIARCATAWAVPKAGILGARLPGSITLVCCATRSHELSALRQAGSPEASRQKAKMTDAHETFRQHVEKETAQELGRCQCHLALLAAASIILPAESDALFYRRRTSGDWRWPRDGCDEEGRLRVDHPVVKRCPAARSIVCTPPICWDRLLTYIKQSVGNLIAHNFANSRDPGHSLAAVHCQRIATEKCNRSRAVASEVRTDKRKRVRVALAVPPLTDKSFHCDGDSCSSSLDSKLGQLPTGANRFPVLDVKAVRIRVSRVTADDSRPN